MLIGGAPAASAHSALSSSDPTDGSTLDAAPTAATLVFNQPIQDFQSLIVVTGPDQQQYPASAPTVDGPTVRSDLGALGPAGIYTIAYRVVSADGHPIQGQVTFTLTSAATSPEPTPEPTSPAAPVTSPAVSSSEPSTPSSSSSEPPTTTAPSSTTAEASTSAAATDDPTAPSSTSPPTQTTTTSSSNGLAGLTAAIAIVLALIGTLAAIIIRRRRGAVPAAGTDPTEPSGNRPTDGDGRS
jgi:methionine-rich copper-binding protein CopC